MYISKKYRIHKLILAISLLFASLSFFSSCSTDDDTLPPVINDTYKGNIILRTQKEVDNFVNGPITKIDGLLIVGLASTTKFDGHVTSIHNINNVSYYFGDTDITNINVLRDHLTDVTQGIFILGNQNISDISSLSQFF